MDEHEFGQQCAPKVTWVAELGDRVAGFSDLEADGHSYAASLCSSTAWKSGFWPGSPLSLTAWTVSNRCRARPFVDTGFR